MVWARQATTWLNKTRHIKMLDYLKKNPQELEYIAVAEASELPPGERMFLDIDDEPIVIMNIGGRYFAIADVCSHDGGPIGEGDIDDCEIRCPRHGATFDIRDGKALSLPAVADIPAYPVRVTDGKIEIGLPVIK
jgi:3-phenylpropionate/trans-cinnamate dioxygenase ferredoxin subunit